MIKVVGVRFRTAGKIYYFDPQKFDLTIGSHVIVETARGIEFGSVIIAPRDVDEEHVIHQKTYTIGQMKLPLRWLP